MNASPSCAYELHFIPAIVLYDAITQQIVVRHRQILDCAKRSEYDALGHHSASLLADYAGLSALVDHDVGPSGYCHRLF